MSEVIFLYGPPGSGKTSLANVMGHQFGWEVFDLDSEVEISVGCAIAEFVARYGIEKFRDEETKSLKKILQKLSGSGKTIVALGGGALLRDENRKICEQAGRVVFLDTPVETILGRVSGGGETRPLLNGDPEEKTKALLREREGHYNSFKLRVANNESINLVTTVERIINTNLYTVGAMGNPYDVIVLPGAVEGLASFLKTITDSVEIGLVFDSNTAKFYQGLLAKQLEDNGIKPLIHAIPAGEEFKTLETIQGIWDFYALSGFDRKSLIVAVGGGVVSDLVGFASATYMRGCQWVCVPTSLLSMVDASIGGKTGFDLPIGKNLIGAFYPPRAVLIDKDFLTTLPDDEFVSGMAEVVKHGIIADPTLFSDSANGIETLKLNIASIINRAVKVKVDVIEEDPFEQGKRASLNLGHTIGHAIELESGFKLKHGEAVSIGMVMECAVAEELGIAEIGLTERISAVLSRIGLPTTLSAQVDKKKVIEFMWNDKKKSGKAIRFALPKKIGEVVTGVKLDRLEEML